MEIKAQSLVSAHRQFRIDCETPVSLFLKLGIKQEYSFLLESVEHGQNSARYSFLGWDPLLKASYQYPEFSCSGLFSLQVRTEQPLPLLKQVFAAIDAPEALTVPNARGGLVGYFSYDAIRLIENIGGDNPDHEPWFDLIFPRNLLIFDHLRHTLTIVCHEPIGDSHANAQNLAHESVDVVAEKIRTTAVDGGGLVGVGTIDPDWDHWASTMDSEEFCRLVDRAKSHIFEGDIFQVVLSRSVRRAFKGEPFEIYRALRQVNPSPYMYYLSFGGRHVVGSSPESLVKLQAGHLTTKPIAGTRPRGKSTVEDLAFEQDLLADQKEIAEHVMLVDLGRNDLGRIAKVGSVSVPIFQSIERYAHVMHIVSEVEAELDPQYHPLDALFSVFPAGTLSGAPKISAMSLIEKFEPESRGIYGGIIGFLDFSGNMDTCIAIRTAVVEKGVVRIQAGAGIVADSVPIKEFEETQHKMRSVACAVERALRINAGRA